MLPLTSPGWNGRGHGPQTLPTPPGPELPRAEWESTEGIQSPGTVQSSWAGLLCSPPAETTLWSGEEATGVVGRVPWGGSSISGERAAAPLQACPALLYMNCSVNRLWAG